MVNFSADVADAVALGVGDDVDSGAVALGEAAVPLGEADGIGSTFRGWNFCAWDLNFPFVSDCGEPVGTSGDPSGTGGLICAEGTVSRAMGEFAVEGCGVTLIVDFGEGVALGTSKRPRRCAADGETAGDEIGDVVAAAEAVGATLAAVRGVLAAIGGEVATGVALEVAVAATDGAAVAGGTDVDLAGDVSAVVALVSVAFTNFFGGAFGGGAASDFIFCRAFFASSWFAIAAQPRSTAAAAMVCFTVGGRSCATGCAITGAAMTTVSPRTSARGAPAARSTFTFRSSR